MNEFMMPHTVPNRPTKGAVAPMAAKMPVPRDTCRVIAASTRSNRRAIALGVIHLDLIDDRSDIAARHRDLANRMRAEIADAPC
jgi:hypothetical protein